MSERQGEIPGTLTLDEIADAVEGAAAGWSQEALSSCAALWQLATTSSPTSPFSTGSRRVGGPRHSRLAACRALIQSQYSVRAMPAVLKASATFVMALGSNASNTASLAP